MNGIRCIFTPGLLDGLRSCPGVSQRKRRPASARTISPALASRFRCRGRPLKRISRIKRTISAEFAHQLFKQIDSFPINQLNALAKPKKLCENSISFADQRIVGGIACVGAAGQR
jgi:hypothetical protein